VVQALAIVSTRKTVRAYDLGINLFFSAILSAGIVLAQIAPFLSLDIRDHAAVLALRVASLAAGVCLSITGLALPRRPDVFLDGELIDRMYAVTAYSRFTFSWTNPTLQLAAKKRNLDLSDLPRPNQYTRAKEVSAWFKKKASSSRLWLSLILVHKVAFALQWTLTLLSAFLNFAPQWIILQILRILEEPRRPDGKYGLDVWLWVVWLGLAIIAQSWIESYQWWLGWAELAVPIRSQLSSLVFEKAMRRKDVKSTPKSQKKEDVTHTDQTFDAAVDATATEATGPAKVELDKEEDDAEALKKSKQSTVNLIGVDSKRVSDFAAYQNILPGSVAKLVVSLVFLIDLLGWKALLAGFSAMLLILPVNIFFSKRYSKAQDNLMKLRDEKMEVVTEALQGIRQIKFSALEPEWEEKIGQVRERELKAVWDVFKYDTMLIACWITSPIALSAISLAVYALLTGSLAPSTAFVSLGVFKALEMTLSVIPELTTDFLDAWVSLKRLQEYLDAPEVTPYREDGADVSFEKATIAWPSDEKLEDSERFVLRGLDVTFPKGELSVIYGQTGTGKSLVLSAILGEAELLGGKLYVPTAPLLETRHDSKANKGNWIIPKALAYVAQIPWIENASIKDNILFGLPYDEERYSQTIDGCALRKDFEMLSDGESTEIGANGINLSGGQKWRVTLARAIYSRAGILVLDDIFSAVDAHVGRHIFEKCLTGELGAGRTRILVTHHVSLVEPRTKYLVELGDGRVLHAGLVTELQEDGVLAQIKSHEPAVASQNPDDQATAVNSDDSADEAVEPQGEDEADGNTLKKVTSKTVARKFVEDEKREEGAIKRHIYATYLQDSGGWVYWSFAILFFCSVQVITIGRSWWLKTWTGDTQEVQNNMSGIYGSLFHSTGVHDYGHRADGHDQSQHQYAAMHALSRPVHIQQEHGLAFYLGIYVLLSTIAAFLGAFRYYYTFIGSVRASRLLFAKLNFRILRTPLRWLDTVPVGRILNRFTGDFAVVDTQLAYTLTFGASSFLNVVGVVVAGMFVSPYVVLFALVLLSICLYYAIKYLHAARPSKRLESNNKSPVFEQFGSALTGVATIRGFDKSRVYIDRMYRKLDDWATSTWHLWLFNRWMGWRMALVGSFFATFVTVLILLTPGISSALAGFAFVFALDFSSSVIWAIRLYANIELNMNAAERIVEYTELQTESLDGKDAPAAWPTEGRLEVNDLVVGYAADLPAVLKGLSFEVKRNERVGVVGRTGAGKSSLTLALFRFLEARSGSILVDGIDISKIKLHDLRSRLAIIPQVCMTQSVGMHACTQDNANAMTGPGAFLRNCSLKP
jgi:ABC-type multidrug transport system fused ATPase/permease subunit